jgi:hypothetical protein
MKSDTSTSKSILNKIIALILWALTALLAGYEIFLTRTMVIAIYFRIGALFSMPNTVLERLSASATGNIGALAMAILAIAIVIGGLDYHWSYAGEPRSYKLFGWTFGFQIGFFILYLLLT